jgi:hypothetical protein
MLDPASLTTRKGSNSLTRAHDIRVLPLLRSSDPPNYRPVTQHRSRRLQAHGFAAHFAKNTETKSSPADVNPFSS